MGPGEARPGSDRPEEAGAVLSLKVNLGLAKLANTCRECGLD